MEKSIYKIKSGMFILAICILSMFITACDGDTVQTSTPTTMDGTNKEHYQVIVDNAVPSKFKGSNYTCVINDETGSIVVNLQLDSPNLNSESANLNAVKKIVGGLIDKSVYSDIKAYNIVFCNGITKTGVAEITNPQAITNVDEVSNHCKISMGASVPATVAGTTSVTTTNTISTTATTKTNTTKLSTTTNAPTTTTERTIYVTPTGKKYHYDNNCNDGTYTPDSLENAKKRGLTPCDKCVN